MVSPRLGSHVLHRVLHEGATAIYHLATHVDEGQNPGPFVVTRFRDSVVRDDLVASELRALMVRRRDFDHAGVSKIVEHHVGPDGEQRDVYCVSPYIPGVPASVLARRAADTSRRVALVVAARIVSEVARTIDTVGEAVGHDVVDIDLQSVRVGWDGAVTVTLPLVVRENASPFDSTPSTAKVRQPSPEAIKGEPIGRASHVFQLGVMLYHLVESRPPFQGTSPMETFLRITEGRPDPLMHPSPELDAVVSRALARNPARRFPRPRDFADAIESKIGTAPRTVIGAEASALCPAQRRDEREMLEDFFDVITVTETDPDDDEATLEELG